MAEQGRWRIWIDRGGTFTDVVGLSPQGQLAVRKVLSAPPSRGEPAARRGDPGVAAIRSLLGLAGDTPLPEGMLEEVRLGTTVATNALLERRGEPVLLLVNRGCADLHRIGDQQRPDLFALHIERPDPLAMRVLEVEGRLGADGQERQGLRLDEALAERVRQARAEGFRSCAVALLHSTRNPCQELALEAWLRQRGWPEVVLSHRLSRQPRLVPRLHTTLVEAALRPVLHRYLDRLQEELGPGTRLQVMTSSGALQTPALLQAKDTILSGPAGGLIGAAAAARAAGLEQEPILGFDMGGTSTDVFHLETASAVEALERRRESTVDGLRVQAPMLPIHTVAAGGGSVLRLADGRLLVGPRSAGADPGPLCYRRGGPLTVTDANVLLGRLPAQALPRLFGPEGDQGADPEGVRLAFERLAASTAAGGGSLAAERLARGALDIANERMAEAIRRISIQQGHDLRQAVLVCFGGAGGQHACALATILGMERVLIHPLAGVLSAWGIGQAPLRQLRERSLRLPLDGALLPQLAPALEALRREAHQAIGAGGPLSPAARQRMRASLELRPRGSERGLELELPPELLEGDGRRLPQGGAALLAELRQAFERQHRRRFGYVVAGEELVVERLQVELVAQEPGGAASGAPSGSGDGGPLPPEAVAVCLGTGPQLRWRQVPLWQRCGLVEGQQLPGPALVQDSTGVTVVEPDWRARVAGDGVLVLERAPGPIPPSPRSEEPQGPAPAHTAGPDPVQLELYNHRFTAIASQMGVRLQQSSRSVNIRERLDFSCALFDGEGQLVANAPHIPVHLGSMGESVAALRRAMARGELAAPGPGDAVAANNPFNGGTHLPDITVITPVFAPGAAGEPIAWVACRGHHADVGGITPGSMPPFSRQIGDEGLLLDNVVLVRQGQLRLQAWRELLGQGPFPVRDPEQLLADLQAQVAANQLGVAELQALMERCGSAEVLAFMAQVRHNAAEAVRRVIARLSDGSHSVELDDGSRIAVQVRIDRERRRARLDFSGTSPQQEGNGNAPLAITRAVVLYVFRCLVGEDIPLNAGCFEPIDLTVPPGCLLHPRPPAAVVAGNVETSQAVANALFAALGVMAASQGTMNNLSFGNSRCQYYETICGGSGAGRGPDGEGFDGASAVQTHMTNSRLTDPEVLEERYPVLVERFAIRRGSGGSGRWRGGDGAERWLRFLEPMTVALLTGSRRVPPFGLAGGEPGACGRNWVRRADGRLESLEGRAQVELAAGDLLCIETPGGGGYGASPSRP